MFTNFASRDRRARTRFMTATKHSSSCAKVFYKNIFLRNFVESIRKHLCRGLCLIKLLTQIWQKCFTDHLQVSKNTIRTIEDYSCIRSTYLTHQTIRPERLGRFEVPEFATLRQEQVIGAIVLLSKLIRVELMFILSTKGTKLKY